MRQKKAVSKEGRLLIVWVLWLISASAGASGRLVENATSPFGAYRGVAYVTHRGRFVGQTSRGSYRVPYEIVAPANPRRGNRRVLVEPPHPTARLTALESLLGADFLFEQGYLHAGVGWTMEEWGILERGAADVFIDSFDDSEIIADFAKALRDDPSAKRLVGSVEHVYTYGYSWTNFPLYQLVHSPIGQGLFDLVLMNGAGLFIPDIAVPHVPPVGAGKILVLQSEADLVLEHIDGEVFRGNDTVYPFYREYEVAGGPHIPDTPALRARLDGLGLPPLEGTTPLLWSSVLRAVFAAGDWWVRYGTPPPPSSTLTAAGPDELDPVYPSLGQTGIARDGNLNALGGIRLPDLAVGRGQFIAVDYSSFELFGDFQDLKCVPLPNGGPRFQNHTRYVWSFAAATLDLVRRGFLLPEDAVALVGQAAHSEVGQPGTCP